MPDFIETGCVSDTFISKQRAIDRLISEYHRFGRIIVAYDFDDTVVPQSGENCSYVVELLQECSKIDTIAMVCFTCRSSNDDLMEVRRNLDRLEIRWDRINDNVEGCPFETSRKILYSIFLDDRAGLGAAYETLVGFLKWYYEEVV